eukprot:symbB.v1.2.002603.t1/scaffold135.1/size305288/23
MAGPDASQAQTLKPMAAPIGPFLYKLNDLARKTWMIMAEELKRQGTAAYAQQEWSAAAEQYTAALESNVTWAATQATMGWFCRCRRRPEDDLIFELPRDGREGFLVTATSESRRALVAERRNPRRTRIFVRMPSGEIFPADMDLDWTTTQASEMKFPSPDWDLLHLQPVGKRGFPQGKLQKRRSGRFRQRRLQPSISEANPAGRFHFKREWCRDWQRIGLGSYRADGSMQGDILL